MTPRRTYHISIFIMLCMILLSLSSCKSRKELVNVQGSTISANEQSQENTGGNSHAGSTKLLDSITDINCSTYSANFSCTIDGISLNGQIRLLNDSVIWVSINKVIELGRAIFTPTRARGYVKLINKYYDGDYKGIAKRWGVDMDFSTMQALLLGNRPPQCVPNSNAERHGDTVTLSCTQNAGNARQVTMKKSQRTLLLDETLIASPSFSEEVSCRYLKRQEVQGMKTPCEIMVRVKSRRLKKATTVKLEKIVFNQQQNYPFSIPKNCENLIKQ